MKPRNRIAFVPPVFQPHPPSVPAQIAVPPQAAPPKPPPPPGLPPEVADAPYCRWVTPVDLTHVIDPAVLADPAPAARLHVCIALWGLQMGGAERTAETAARWLSERHRVTVWCTYDPPEGGWFLTDIGGAELRHGPSDAFVRFVTEERVDVVVSVNNTAGDVFRSLPCPVLTWRFGLLPWTIEEIRRGLELNCVPPNVATWTFRHIGAGFKHFGYQNRVYRFLGPQDVERYPHRGAYIPGNPLRLGYVGRLSPEKDYPAMGAVIRYLNEHLGVPARWVLIGGVNPGVLPGVRKQAEAEEQRFETYPDVIWLRERGLVERVPPTRDVRPHIESLDALLITSKFEGEPMVLMEAMACGVLCAARPIGAIPDLLDGAGLLTNATTPMMSAIEVVDMATGLARACRDHDEYGRLTDRARERVERDHAEGPWVRDAERVFADCILRARRPAAVGGSRPDVTVALITTGTPTAQAAREALACQNTKTVLLTVENVCPMPAAFNDMVTRCGTPLLVQVDEDMVLDPDALTRMVAAMDAASAETWMLAFPLMDSDLGEPIMGCKVYRTEIARRFPFPARADCEMGQIEQARSAGFFAVEARDERPVGKHVAFYDEASAFSRYYWLGTRSYEYIEKVGALAARDGWTPRRVWTLLGAALGWARHGSPGERTSAEPHRDFLALRHMLGGQP